MNLKSSFWYATKILNSPFGKNTTGRRSLVGAIFCIALSLVPLVVVQTVADGMIEGITSRMVGLSSYHAAAELENTRKTLEKQSFVQGAFVEVSGTALAAGKNGRSGAQIRAINNRLFTENSAFLKYINVVEGTTNLLNSSSAVIGKKIAQDLGVHVGDSIRLIGTMTLANGKVIPKVKIFKISGIVSSGYEELDALWVFVPLASGMAFLSGSSSQFKIGLEIDGAFTNNFALEISEIKSKLSLNWSLFTWSELNSSQYENFASTRILLLFIMFLILLISSVNISAAIVMVVMERRSEIAILKSMGASPSGITASFILCGTFCGLGGVVIGIPLGLLCSINVNEILDFIQKIVNVCAKFMYLLVGKTDYIPVELLNPAYYLDSIPIHISFTELFVIAIGTICLSMIVSFLPSVHAGQEKPLSIFRKL